MEIGASKYFSEWKLADTVNKGFVFLENITVMDEFMTADEEVKWDKYNGCVYKMYIMYEMSE